MRERESFFNEYIVEVRRREKDEKQQKKEQVCTIVFFSRCCWVFDFNNMELIIAYTLSALDCVIILQNLFKSYK